MAGGSFDSGKLWSAGIARKAMVPTKTHNPTPAAAKLLGPRVVSRGKRVLRRAGKKRAYKGNPVPAAVSTAASFVPGGSLITNLLGGKVGPVDLKSRAAYEAGRASSYDIWYQEALSGNKGSLENLRQAGGVDTPGMPGPPWPHIAPSQGSKDYAAAKYQLAKAALASKRGNVTPGMQGIQQLLATPGAPQAIAGVTRAVLSGTRRRRGSLHYYDSYGRPHYTSRPPGAYRLPRGAQLAPEAQQMGFTALNPFFGKVGGGSAAQTAGQVAVAAAAGVGAYLVTQRLLEYLGGRAQSQEEAGVNAARALHQALEDYKKQHGAYPPPAERQRMKAAYQAELVKLGYDPVTFARSRGAISDFLETYNPFGG